MTKKQPLASHQIDVDAVVADYGARAAAGENEYDLRNDLFLHLKEMHHSARTEIESLLVAEGAGTRCAQRLSRLQDDIVQVICGFAANHVYHAVNPSTAERIAVVAVGGYGRGTLAPGSDVDLLFLLPYKQTPWGESVVEYILYMLWDLGLKVGHATRSVDECVRLSRNDMTIRTAMLETRYICGDRSLFDEAVRRFDEEVVKSTGPEFIAAKLGERDDRHKRQGASRYLVEPNVKEGKGGLRDLHTLYWIGKYFYRTSDAGELIKAGVFSRREYALFRKCEDFLWAVRCHLHFMTGRAEERLTFDLQPEMARRLGYTAHPGLKDVERFMKHYFLVAKDVGDLTRIFCAALEHQHAKPAPMLNRLLASVSRRRSRKLSGSTDFLVDHDRITVVDDEVFKRDPVNLLRIFELADRNDLAFHPDVLRLITRSLRLVNADLRENPEANRIFVDILTSPNEPEAVLRLMNETGVLGRFILDFGKIVAMMQFNMYHHYTVDEHLLRSVGILAEIDRGKLGDDHPLAHELIGSIESRKVLYLAVLLHDIAKGRPEDHSIVGARIARRLGKRLGFTPAETETTAWLVEHHLTMSVYAQSRDLNDLQTIRDFARIVQDLERLKMLLILTVADIRAVGPGVWNGWKGQLLRTLYYEAEPILAGGHTAVSRARRVEAAKAEFTAALSRWPDEVRERCLALHYPAYWLRVDLPRKIEHAALVRRADEAGEELATDVRIHDFEGVTELTVLAPDHARLLAITAGACAAAGADIVDAQIYTTTDGRALDAIFIRREFDNDADEFRRASRVTTMIEQVLSGEVQLTDIVARKPAPKPKTRAFKIEGQVVVTNARSDLYTVIEVTGLDRPGLLYDLTTEISALKLNIASAQIVTFGERAVDVFYVTDLVGRKLPIPGRDTEIKQRLGQVLNPPPAKAGAAKPPRRAAASA